MAEVGKVGTNDDLLDKLTVEYFEVLEELLGERRKLELEMRNGFFEIAKSRHSMGSRSVGSLQLPSPSSDKCFQASFKVETNITKTDLIEKIIFDSSLANNSEEIVNDATDAGLRKRFHDEKAPESNVKSSRGNSNSLKWFGILLPPSMRASKREFENSLHSVCKIASLQISLIRIQQEFKKINENLVADIIHS